MDSKVLFVLVTFSQLNVLLFKYFKPSKVAMAAYERKHEMGDPEAYEEEVKKDLKDEGEGDLCFEKSPVSYQIRNSQFPPDKEKKISVDPVSVKQLAKVGDHLSRSPLALPPLGKQPKFITCSLPSPALSPPRSSSDRRKSFKKWEVPAEQLHPVLRCSLARQHSTKPSHFTPQQGILLHRSKSCGEGRSCAPSDEVDIFSRRASTKLPESGVRVLYDCTDDDDDDAGNQKDPEEPDPPVEENFKCGALCLFLPGFSKKKKQVQASLDEEEDQGSVVSRAVSLGKFECGSWSSAAILDADGDDDGAGRSYFDLPLELIRSSTDDANSPVKTAFVFDRERKGVLKKSTSTLAPRKSHEGSNRHVRFSTSTPTLHPTSPTSACITPRLRKAREEFNAFLEAQST